MFDSSGNPFAPRTVVRKEYDAASARGNAQPFATSIRDAARVPLPGAAARLPRVDTGILAV